MIQCGTQVDKCENESRSSQFLWVFLEIPESRFRFSKKIANMRIICYYYSFYHGF